jgi:superfamily I DNA and RNA helicase
MAAATSVHDDPARLASDLERWPFKKDDDAETESQFEQRDVISAVALNSIVGAKGLSADHVIVIGCDQVSLDRISSSAFFVALTRARKSLTLLMCVGGGGASLLHDFICSLSDEHSEALYVKTDSTEERETIGELQGQLKKMDYAREMGRQGRFRS